ncbi:MAG: metal/formaldehyde-sensitive transcriptional repressor [Acidobacteria bacterium]|nr:metal/formaldehyde-sensitive transcriptional repressor [Acidobacteriota bacterium]
MPQIDRERTKLSNRMKRIRGQMESVERKIETDKHDCADVLMQLAAVRGGINSLMAEILEDHIRLHLLHNADASLTPDLGEDLIDLVRAYLK